MEELDRVTRGYSEHFWRYRVSKSSNSCNVFHRRQVLNWSSAATLVLVSFLPIFNSILSILSLDSYILYRFEDFFQFVQLNLWTISQGYSDTGLFRIHVQMYWLHNLDRRNSPAGLTFCFACSSETEERTRLKQVPTCAADDFGHNSASLQSTTSKNTLKRVLTTADFSCRKKPCDMVHKFNWTNWKNLQTYRYKI